MSTGIPLIDALDYDSARDRLIAGYQILITGAECRESFGAIVTERDKLYQKETRIGLVRIIEAKNLKELVVAIIENKKAIDGLKAGAESSED